MLIDTTDTEISPTSRKPARTRGNRWHAVTVLPGADACEAAQSCRGKRFLSHEAPRFPLPDCKAAHCRCRYRHHADRRGATRRREAAARATEERRSSSGRRRSDRLPET